MFGNRESVIGNRLKGVAVAFVLAAAFASRAGAQTIAIAGGKVYPVSGPVIENGTVLVRDGRIVAVGANVTVPNGATRIDATGKWVTPGLINAQTGLGVTEVGAVPGTVDRTARGDNGVAASFPIWEGINPASTMLAPARMEGITSVLVVPTGGLISGQAAVIDLVSGTVTDMVNKAPVAMVAQFGDPRSGGSTARGEQYARLKEILEDARTYSRRRSDFDRAQTRTLAARRADLEALIPVVEGRLPLLFNADQASDIEAVLRLARELNVKVIITGGAESWLLADRLAAANVPIIIGSMNNIPTSFATLGQRQDAPALLQRAGARVVLIANGSGGEEVFNVRNLKYDAGVAVAYGMPWDAALRAITLTPAEVLGVANRVGSLQPGRDANLVVWSGDPFEFTTRAEHVFIRGREIAGPSRQDELMQRYKSYPPAYRKSP
ncbi:MAG TPA: amidohydrolase family protein [Gemmatimonadaceae bacterium]|nr:amidohydrolase family protein [Gemmatimonadaceae bacterium]